MHARIISDLPGRLRIRAGQDAFSRAQGYTLEQQMMRHPFISGCIANANNGSVLIHYRPEKRAQIFYLLDQLRIEDLEDGEPLDGDRRILTATFTRGIVRRTVMK